MSTRGVPGRIEPVCGCLIHTIEQVPEGTEALDLTMGQAIADLTGHELATVIDEASDRGFSLQSALEGVDRLDTRKGELDDRGTTCGEPRIC